MFADVRYALRQLRRSPAFTAAAVLTLALGISAAATIFSVADAVLLRPLPYPESDRLVIVNDELSKIGAHINGVSFETLQAYQNIPAFDASAAFTEDDRNLIGTGAAARVSVISSTPGLFQMLGARTLYGRGLDHQDWNSANNAAAILSYSLFASRFGANPSIIGKPLRLDGRLYTVVGVMAPQFAFALGGKNTDVWIPLASLHDPNTWQFRMLARLRPGAGLESARASLIVAAKHVEETIHPYRGPNGEDPGYRVDVISLRTQLLGDFRTGSLLLLGAVALLLLIACANVANLLFARSAAREKETAIRRSLGASGVRLLRQWTTEAAVLSAIGGVLGLVASYWGVLLLKAISPAELPAAADIRIDARVLVFTIAISGIVCVLLSLASTFVTGQRNVSLRGPRRKRRLADVLVTSEVAIALVLVIGCGLLAKSFARLRHIDPGVRVDHVLTMRIQLSGNRYQEARQRARFFSDLQDRLTRLPGVSSASAVDRLPVFTVGVDTTSGNPFSTG